MWNKRGSISQKPKETSFCKPKSPFPWTPSSTTNSLSFFPQSSLPLYPILCAWTTYKVVWFYGQLCGAFSEVIVYLCEHMVPFHLYLCDWSFSSSLLFSFPQGPQGPSQAWPTLSWFRWRAGSVSAMEFGNFDEPAGIDLGTQLAVAQNYQHCHLIWILAIR